MHLAFTTPLVSTCYKYQLTSSTFTRCPQQKHSLRPARLQFCTRRRFAVMSAAAADDDASNDIVNTDVEAGTVEPVEEQVATAVADDPNRVKGILMLCLGNICRSPAAEAVMNKVLSDRGLNEKYFVDSCGTGGGSLDWYMENGFSHHTGSAPDIRMQYAAKQRGYVLDTRSRPLNKDDFDRFDYIIAMDSSNLDSVETARQHWGIDDDKANGKVMLMSEFSSDESFRGKGVPDPYYSGQDGFDHALDLILDSCNGLADFLVKPAT